VVWAHNGELLPDILEGRLDDMPHGYRVMNKREVIKAMIEI